MNDEINILPVQIWRKLNRLDRKIILWRARCCWARHRLRRIYSPPHPILKLSGYFTAAAFLQLAALPPAHQVPPIALPLILAGALCFAALVYTIIHLAIPNLVRQDKQF